MTRSVKLRIGPCRWRVAAALLASLLAACSPGSYPIAAAGPGGIDVMMPPDEYIRPFQGKVTVMRLPHETGSPVLSLSHHFPGQCAVWLPSVGDSGISEALYKCLAVIEIANCNGAADINTPAVGAHASMRERVKYSRLCSQRDWDWAYNAVRRPVQTVETAVRVGRPLF